MAEPTPSVGRVVHYVSHGSADGTYGKECRAAVVTEVEGHAIHPQTGDEADAWVVGLAVLNPTGQFFNRGCVQDPSGDRGGSWHWPERV